MVIMMVIMMTMMMVKMTMVMMILTLMLMTFMMTTMTMMMTLMMMAMMMMVMTRMMMMTMMTMTMMTMMMMTARFCWWKSPPQVLPTSQNCVMNFCGRGIWICWDVPGEDPGENEVSATFGVSPLSPVPFCPHCPLCHHSGGGWEELTGTDVSTASRLTGWSSSI